MREQEDPAAYHGYPETPKTLCALAVRVASKSMLQTSVVSSFILAYCAVLCWAGPRPEEGSAKLLGLRIVSWLCIVVWFIELAAKVAGFGLRPFLRNNWNLLDSACLISLAIDLAVPGVSFAYLRLLKVSRPLLHYSAFAQFQRALDAIIRSCRSLPPMLGLTGLFIFLCAMFGSQLFGSDRQLYNRCVKPAALKDGRTAMVAQESGWRRWSSQGLQAVGVVDATGPLSAEERAFYLVLPESHCVNQTGLGLGAYSCDAGDGQVCKKIVGRPAFPGLESFDNTLSAVVVVVLAILQQKYDHVFEGTMDTAGDLAGLYFLVITLVGAFFLLNYTTAIIADSYARGRDWRVSKYVALEHAEAPVAGEPRLKEQELADDISLADVNALHTKKISQQGTGYRQAADFSSSEERQLDRSFRQFFRRLSSPAAIQCAKMLERVKDLWRAFARPLAVLMAFPTAVGVDEHFSALHLRATPWSEIIMRVGAVVHVALLASITRDSSSEYMATVSNADGWFVWFFVVMEVLRVCAYAGLARYLSGSWEHVFDFLTALVTAIIWLSGGSLGLQLGPVRAVRLHAIVWNLKPFQRTKHVLLVCAGRDGELLISCAAVILCYCICAILLRQIFAGVELEDERQMFTTFPSAMISLLETTAGDSLQTLLMEGQADVGTHAVLIGIGICFLVKHVINKILTAVVLQNLVSPEHDKMYYQLQFERLSWLHGWTPAQQSFNWRHIRDHLELLRHGEKHILVPDTAGSFERVYAHQVAAKFRQDGVGLGKGRRHGEGRRQVIAGRCPEGTAQSNSRLERMVQGGVALLRSWNQTVHRSMQLSATYWIRMRVVHVSNVAMNQDGRYQSAGERKVRIQLCKMDEDGGGMVILESKTSGNPVDYDGTRWADAIELGPVSRDACFQVSILDTVQGSEVILGQATDTIRRVTASREVVRSYVLRDHADEDLVLDPQEMSQRPLVTLQILCEPDHSHSTALARARLKLRCILQHKAFERTILLLILLCILLPIVEFEMRNAREFHHFMDVVFLVVFTAEAVLKMLGFGIWYEPDAYFRSVCRTHLPPSFVLDPNACCA